MDYLTNYYKNLSEQLQEKLNILEAQINEAMSEQEALGMPVPILRSGKGGNYEEWRAAKDARNAALRQARLGIGNRERVLAAREKRRKEKGTTTTEPLKIDTKPRIPGMSDDIDIMPKPDFTRDDRFPLMRDTKNIIASPQNLSTRSGASIIPQSTTLNTANTTQQPQNTPLEKDTIKNFVQSIRDELKPGQKIKKTPSKILYRDEDETPYIQ